MMDMAGPDGGLFQLLPFLWHGRPARRPAILFHAFSIPIIYFDAL